MGGLFQSARAAQAEAGSQTMSGGNVPEPLEEKPTSEPVKTAAYAEEPAPKRPVFDESLALLPDDPGAAARGEQSSALPPGAFDRALARYKEQSGMLSRDVEGSPERVSPFARLGADTEENPLRVRKEAAPKPVRQQFALNNDSGAKADSYAKYEEPAGSEKALGFGQLSKPQDQNADPALRVAQNSPTSQKAPTSKLTPDGYTKHDGEIEVEQNPQLNTTIESEAAATREKVNPRWLKIIAFLESSAGKKKDAVGAKYIGVFQFGDAAWKEFNKGGNRSDPVANTRAMINELTINQEKFLKEFKREPTLTELYLTHQQGWAGARALFRNPDELAWKVRTLSTIESNLSNNEKPLAPFMKSREFIEYWDKRIAGGTGYGTWKLP